MKPFEDSVVLVSGASGLIGRHLVDELLNSGAVVIALGRSMKKLEKSFSEKQCGQQIRLCSGDLSVCVPDGVGKVDYIFHAAGSISGSEIRERPVETINSHLFGLRNCMEYLKTQGYGRLVVFSSATVYGNEFCDETVVDERATNSCEFLSGETAAYSESKRMSEVLASAYAKQYGVDSVISRMSYVYGYSNPAPNTAFFSFIRSAVQGANIEILRDRLPCRDNIYVEDVVRGLMIIASEGKRGEAYNVSSNGDLGNYQAMDQIGIIISDVAAKLGIGKIRVISNQVNARREPGMRMDNSKLKALGWQVSTDIYQGIEKTLKMYVKDRTNR